MFLLLGYSLEGGPSRGVGNTEFIISRIPKILPCEFCKSVSELYQMHESRKCADYEQRVLQTEKAHFTPLIYSTHGGMGDKAVKFHKRVAQLYSAKTGEKYSHIINCHRTKISFAMLKSVLLSLRGVRGRMNKVAESPLQTVSFNLIPDVDNYEGF